MANYAFEQLTHNMGRALELQFVTTLLIWVLSRFMRLKVSQNPDMFNMK